VNRRVTADFAVNRQVGGDDGQPTAHRLHQRMSKSLRIGSGDINVRAAVQVPELAVRNGAQLKQLALNAQLPYQSHCAASAVTPGTAFQLACQHKLNTPPDALANQPNGAEHRLKIAIVVVVADEKQSQD